MNTYSNKINKVKEYLEASDKCSNCIHYQKRTKRSGICKHYLYQKFMKDIKSKNQVVLSINVRSYYLCSLFERK